MAKTPAPRTRSRERLILSSDTISAGQSVSQKPQLFLLARTRFLELRQVVSELQP